MLGQFSDAVDTRAPTSRVIGFGSVVHVDVPNQGTSAGAPSRLLRGYKNCYGAIQWPITRSPLSCWTCQELKEPCSGLRNTPEFDTVNRGQAGRRRPLSPGWTSCSR